MIRRGKEEGWLSLPVNTLMPEGRSLRAPFASTYGVNTDAAIAKVSDIPGKGGALVATSDMNSDQANVLLTVPRDLVLSRENAILLSKTDRHLHDVLEATSNTDVTTTRHVILILLLIQATHNCPSIADRIGIPNPFSDYIKFLPLELLPTFWTDDEIDLLTGTTLKPATEAKINSLYREFEQFRLATSSSAWCQKHWWDEIDGLLQFDDWKQVDAMYRSRALEFPGIGNCMIPCIDMANHASGDATVARYEADPDGNALLWLHDGKAISAGHEITISYGDEKGACEMIFSYGFLQDGLSDAHTLFLDIQIPRDDPLAQAKRHTATCAPGVRLTMHQGEVVWESPFVWLAIVNEEDGLDFRLLQTVDGSTELEILWKGAPLVDTAQIEPSLSAHSLWGVYRLRAISLIQDRIDLQMLALGTAEEDHQDDGTCFAYGHHIRELPKTLAIRLRMLERTLLESASKHFQTKKSQLLASVVVQDYLQQMSGPQPEDEEDFS